ncbi:MAG: class I SAM-dependent methyltransferase [Candidatus Bruticola sp.]
MNNSLTFLCEFFRKPGQVGAIYPSSQELAEEIVTQAGTAQAKVIVEFGAGTGVFTKEIIKRKPEQAVFFTIEQNKSLVDILKKELPQADICCDSAAELPRLLQERNLTQVDTVVSGLPWAAFNEDLQNQLLDPVLQYLSPGGRFVTFAYLQGLLLPAGRRFAQKIKNKFSEVKKSRVIWGNLPPAFVYICTKK